MLWIQAILGCIFLIAATTGGYVHAIPQGSVSAVKCLVPLVPLLVMCDPVDSYYEILGVKQTASTHEIKVAFRKLALQWHPDKHRKDPSAAEEHFRKIAQAYDVLSNVLSRDVYDSSGRVETSDAVSEFEGTFEELFRSKVVEFDFEDLPRLLLISFYLFDKLFDDNHEPVAFNPHDTKQVRILGALQEAIDMGVTFEFNKVASFGAGAPHMETMKSVEDGEFTATSEVHNGSTVMSWIKDPGGRLFTTKDDMRLEAMEVNQFVLEGMEGVPDMVFEVDAESYIDDMMRGAFEGKPPIDKQVPVDRISHNMEL